MMHTVLVFGSKKFEIFFSVIRRVKPQCVKPIKFHNVLTKENPTSVISNKVGYANMLVSFQKFRVEY